MKLYLAYYRTPYEGGSVLGIYRSEDAAQTRIDKYKKERSYKDSSTEFGIEPVDTNTDLEVYF